MTKINMKITHLKYHWNLPGANELTAVLLALGHQAMGYVKPWCMAHMITGTEYSIMESNLKGYLHHHGASLTLEQLCNFFSKM